LIAAAKPYALEKIQEREAKGGREGGAGRP
jgi:hypothetical protein